jgi:hypothetical protein
MPLEKTNPPLSSTLPVPIKRRIYVIRGQKVMLDADLAELYQVPTKRLNEAIRRNRDRFPEDFMFRLSNEEASVLRSQIATLETGRRPTFKICAPRLHGTRCRYALVSAPLLHAPCR